MDDLKQEMQEEGLSYELVPKGQHRGNIAENCIGSWTSTAVRVFSDMNSKCPIFLWDLMLLQIDIQVNLQQQSNTTPKVSTHARLYGAHHFNQHHSNQYFYMKRTEYMVLNTKMYIACDTKGIFFIVVGWPEGPLSRVKK